MKEVLDLLRAESAKTVDSPVSHITGTILTLDQPNANGRTYTTEVAEAIIEQARDRIAVGALLGEVGYPEGSSFNSVDMNRVSHQVTDLRIENGQLIGVIKLLKTPMGEIAEKLIYEAPHVGFRPRGHATIDKNGVVSDYQLVTIDLVANPA